VTQAPALAFFRATHEDGRERLVPLELARSLWGGGQLHGVALSAALARSAERAVADRGDLRPARFTVDLFRAADMRPCTVTATVVRKAPRLCLVDATLAQDDEPVARASAVFLKPTQDPPGETWLPSDAPEPPSTQLAPVTDEPHVPFLHSDGLGWSQDFGAHQNAARKQTWQTAVPTVEGERPSPFVTVAGIADATSMVTNWGTQGVEFINADITLTLGRLPEGPQVGLSTVDRVMLDGIAVGTATVFDRAGRLGTAVVTALANSRRAVDFERVEFTDDGRRTAPGV